jgi:hypothetical protein
MEILPGTRDLSLNSEWKTGVGAAGYSLHIRVRTFAIFSDETVDPRCHNGQRYRAELEHSIVESADVEFRSERLLRFFASTHDRELAHVIREGLPGPGDVTVYLGFDFMLG